MQRNKENKRSYDQKTNLEALTNLTNHREKNNNNN